jgi:transcriptional regulator with XRE-family HTH domain
MVDQSVPYMEHASSCSEYASFENEKGVSLRELARRAGVGLATLSRIESGEANPRLSTLLQLAEVLGVFVGDLFEKPSRGKGGK